ncbi:MAG: sigma-54 dependent transcriptional regulator [Verrucomicrobiota bacterium]
MEPLTLAGLDILVVEDELLLRKQIAAALERLEADVYAVGTLAAARQMLRDQAFGLVLLDINLPDGAGTDLLREEAFAPATSVIVMTAQGGVTVAVEAMRLGAADFLSKPFDLSELPLVVARAQRGRQSARREEHRRSDDGPAGDTFFFGSALAGLQALAARILAADQRLKTALPPVLIQGETGTGKTTIARWLHRGGPRAAQALVEVNCSALPEALAESELFGHERGAFTDARATRIGLFEAASGGTLFLDEVPSLSPNVQAKVLKAIEEHRVRRLGGTRDIPVDVRVIAATNRDLKELVAAGQFREDLFHRLDLYRIVIPPLRERGDDVVKMAELLLAQLCRRHRLAMKSISAAGRQRLRVCPWPGNVRELAHELERAIVFEDGEVLDFENLPTPIDPLKPLEQTEWLRPDFKFPAEGFRLEEAIGVLVRQALKQSGGNVSAAARLLGVSRDYLRYRLAGQKAEGSGGN